MKELKAGHRRKTRRYAFLFSDFKDEFIYWESVIQTRKLAMAAVVALLPQEGVETQTVTALGVLCMCIAGQVRYRPYQSPRIDEMEIFSLMCSFFTLYFGLLLNAQQKAAQSASGNGGEAEETWIGIGFTFLIVLVNMVFIGRFFWLLMSIMRARSLVLSLSYILIMRARLLTHRRSARVLS